MLDWLTMKTERINLEPGIVSQLEAKQGCVCKIAADGAVEWATPSREIVRSDSHQLQVHLTAHHLLVMGSPARVVGNDNVFGSGHIVECAHRMLTFVEAQLWCDLPAFDKWRVTRVDVTHNYDMESAANVRQALLVLRHAHGGRYQVRTESESVYWSVKSKHRSGKAYHKGPHMEFQRKQGADYSDDQINLAQRILRLELKLGSKFWHEQTKPWYEFTEGDFNEQHERYFRGLIGNCEVAEMKDVRQQCIDAAKVLGMSEGRGKAAFGHWSLIMAHGYEFARDNTPKSTHHKHVKVLMQAGISFADFQAGRVVALRRKPLVLAQPVTSWDELRAA